MVGSTFSYRPHRINIPIHAPEIHCAVRRDWLDSTAPTLTSRSTATTGAS